MTTNEIDKKAMDLYLSGEASSLEEAYQRVQDPDLEAVKDLFRKAGLNL